MRRQSICVIGLSLMAGTLAWAQAGRTEKPAMYTYVSEWGIPRAMWADYQKAEPTLTQAVKTTRTKDLRERQQAYQQHVQQLEQTMLDLLGHFGSELQALRQESHDSAGGRRNGFKRWLYGTGNVFGASWRDETAPTVPQTPAPPPRAHLSAPRTRTRRANGGRPSARSRARGRPGSARTRT